jgi:CHAT domain-containing protein
MRIAELQRSLIHDRLTNAQTKRVLAKLDAAYDQLGPHQLFVEYVLDRQASYALEVSNRGMRVHQLPSRERIAALTRNYLIAVKAGRDSRTQAQALYSVLIAPLATRGWNSLIIVPDGNLHLIPFEPLQGEMGEYLTQRAKITIAPSATVLATLRREPEGETPKTFWVWLSAHPETNCWRARRHAALPTFAELI